YFNLSSEDKKRLKGILLELPFGFDYNLSLLREFRFLSDLEAVLGAPAFSSLPGLDRAHRQLARELEQESPAPSLALDDCFALIHDAFDARSFHVLIDGLDGFMET